MKTLHRLAGEVLLSADPPTRHDAADGLQASSSRQGQEALLAADRPTWMVLMSCYVRVLQACRYSLASIRATLDKNSIGLLAGLHVEGAMMEDDEPGLKVLLLLQVLEYRLNALAAALGLPGRHRLAADPPGPAASGAATADAAANVTSVASVVDWILQGDSREKSVFGSPTATKENITEALRAEFAVLRGMVS